MRAIVTFLFVASITLLLGLYHALGRLQAAEGVVLQFHDQRGPDPWHGLPPAYRPQPPMRMVIGPTHQPAPRLGQSQGRSIHMTVVGKPQTDEHKAYEAALIQARDRLISELRELKPDLSWEGPRLAKLERFITKRNTTSEYMKPPVDTVMWTTTLELELTPSDQNDLLRHVRLEDARQRQLYLFKPMLAVLVVLLTVAGYYRLEDATKGYYTLLLRLSAGAAIALAAASLYFLV